MLRNPRHENFARALARGASQVSAYEEAGFRRRADCASRLALKPHVHARVEALRGALAAGEAPAMIFADLLRLAHKAEGLGTPAGLSAARAALAAAAALSETERKRLATDAWNRPSEDRWEPEDLTTEQWLEKHTPPELKKQRLGLA
jgi:hypothetical protein